MGRRTFQESNKWQNLGRFGASGCFLTNCNCNNLQALEISVVWLSKIASIANVMAFFPQSCFPSRNNLATIVPMQHPPPPEINVKNCLNEKIETRKKTNGLVTLQPKKQWLLIGRRSFWGTFGAAKSCIYRKVSSEQHWRDAFVSEWWRLGDVARTNPSWVPWVECFDTSPVMWQDEKPKDQEMMSFVFLQLWSKIVMMASCVSSNLFNYCNFWEDISDLMLVKYQLSTSILVGFSLHNLEVNAYQHCQ